MNRDSWTFKTIFKNQTKLAAYIIICTTLVVLGASYALFFQVDSNSNNQIVEAGTLTFAYSNNTVINNAICFEPMSLDEAKLFATECSYQLSITNTGTLIADYNLFLVPREDNTADLSNLKLILRQNGTPVSGYPKGVVSGAGDSTHVGTTDSFLTGSINPGDTILYSAQIYVDDTTNFAGSENKKVSFDIRGALVVSDDNPISGTRPDYSGDTLAKLQSLNSSLIVTPSTASNPDFSIIAPSDTDGQTSGIYEAEDDYGASYYFRGVSDNNFVKFGKWQTDYYNGYNASTGVGYGQFTTLSACEAEAGSGNCTKYASAGDDMYWKIVRINGDGSIRMIYDGTSIYGPVNEEDGLTVFRSIGTGAFNNDDIDNAYVGYMYGTPNSNTYEATHANTNNSEIKNQLDNWYQTQMSGYSSYILDRLFCNDRSVGSNDIITYLNENWNPQSPYTSNGFGNSTTIYGARERLLNEEERDLGNTATLKCPNKSDRFTVSDTANGNGALTYPVGLITIDEANMAGIAFDGNESTYLHIGKTFWTMSPSEYDLNGALNHAVNSLSYIYNNANPTNPTIAIRPVININPDYINAGEGTDKDPFRRSDLEITITPTNSPANGSTWAFAESVYCDVSFKNIGSETIENIEAIIAEDDGLEIDSLAPNSSSPVVHFEKIITEEDILNGSYDIVVEVSGTNLDDEIVENRKVYSINNIEAPNPSLTITYSGINSSYHVGDTIYYGVSITNNGNLTLTDLEIDNSDEDNPFTEPDMAPAEWTQPYSYTHIIKADEVSNGHITLSTTVTADTQYSNNPTITVTENYLVNVN